MPGICGTISAVVAATMAVKVLTRTGQWPGNVMGEGNRFHAFCPPSLSGVRGAATYSGCYFVTASYLFYGPGSISFLGFMGPFVGQVRNFD